MRQLQTTTLLNQNISSYLLADTYTADANRAILFRVMLDQVLTSGDYYSYVTVQESGIGAAYRLPTFFTTVDPGASAIAFPSIILPVNSGDVTKVYVKGLSTDTTTPDITTKTFELSYLKSTIADRFLTIGTDGVVDANLKKVNDTLQTAGDLVDRLSVLYSQLLAVSGYVNVLPDVWITPPSGDMWTPERAVKIDRLDNLDIPISTISGYVDVLPNVWITPPSGSLWTPERATKIDYLDVAISSRHPSGVAVAKSPATLDWLADVTNKPVDFTANISVSGVVSIVTSRSDFTLNSSSLSSNDDDYNNMWLVFMGGNNKYVPRIIGDYTGVTKRVQFTGSTMRGAFPEVVQSGDAFMILGGVE